MTGRSQVVGADPTPSKSRQGKQPIVRVIRPPRGLGFDTLREVWEFRELLLILASRDIKVRYKQTLLGLGWVVIQPLMTVVVFTVLFARVAKVPSEGVPYPVFALAAMVPWGFFSGGASTAAGSIVSGASLIRKVYFPRIIIPFAGIVARGVDFIITLTLLAGFMVWYGVPFSSGIILVPVLVIMAATLSLGVGLLLAAINVRYRDVRQLVPYLFQLWLLATPVAYPGNVLPEPWDRLYVLNPMAGVVEGFRWALLGVGDFPAHAIGISGGLTLVVVLAGFLLFQRMERQFADIV